MTALTTRRALSLAHDDLITPFLKDHFSSTSNWDNESPLSVATSLVFGPLPAQCTSAPTPADTCYHATNDESGVSVNSISFNDSRPYVLQGNPIALGAGGFTAVYDGGDYVGGWVIPLNLTASQSWSVAGWDPRRRARR